MIPAFFVKYGEYRFFISNERDILVRKGSTEYLIKGENEKLKLTHLAAEGNFLFALRNDGVILQWHYATGELIQEIITSYAENDPRLQKIKKECHQVCVFRNSFYVNDDYIVLNYGKGRHNAYEVIPLNNVRENYLILDKDAFASSKIKIKNNNLFIVNRNDVFIWDLHKRLKVKKFTLLKDQTYFIWDFIVKANSLYSTNCFDKEKLSVHDMETKKKLKSFSSQVPRDFMHIEIVGKILYGFCHYLPDRNQQLEYTQSGAIYAFDLQEERVIETVPDVLDFETLEMKPHVLKTLVDIAVSSREAASTQYHA